MAQTVPMEKEIDEMLDRCNEENYDGMSYADGVKAGIEWVMGYTQDPPFESAD